MSQRPAGSVPRPDVAVLGGGIAGLTVARELLVRGRSVAVLRSSRPAASLVAAGILAPMPELVLNPRLGRLAAEGLRFYPEFLAALAENTDMPTGFVRSGVLRVARDAGEAEAMREGAGSYEAAGIPSLWLSARATLEAADGLNPDVVAGGLLSYDEAQVQPAWLLAALEDAIGSLGGELLDAEVDSLSAAGRGVGVQAHFGNGEDLAFEAAAAVLAMGSWSGTLPGLAYPVRPVKGQLLAYRGVAGPGPIVYWGHDYLLTKADGTVILGGTMEEAGYSLAVDAAVDELRARGEGVWPALAGAASEARVGLRPAAPDGLPVMGPLPELPAAYVFTAHFRNGFLVCPAAARMAAGEITGGDRVTLFEPLRPGRLRGQVV